MSKTKSVKEINKKKEIVINMDEFKDTPNVTKFVYDKDLPGISERRLEFLRKQVRYLQTVPQPEQRSPEWYAMRNNMITASDWAAALGENPYSYRKALIRKKCGEDSFYFGKHMMHGVKYEDVAVAIYEARNNVEIIEFGCLPHPTISCLGASPDGITKDGVMVEIKCPPSREITGIPPRYYWIQVQGQLEVCDLDRCDFLECKIEEYSGSVEHEDPEDEYFNDNYEGDYSLNETGMEKGIVLCFERVNDKKAIFRYSRLGLNDREEFKEWEMKEKKDVLKDSHRNDKLVYLGASFWKLTKVSCVPIYRDVMWFHEAGPKLQEFWNDVVHYRKVGIDELLTPRMKANRLKKQQEKEKYWKDRERDQLMIDTKIEDFKNGSRTKESFMDEYNEYNDVARMKNLCLFTEVEEPRNFENKKTTKMTQVEFTVGNTDNTGCMFSLSPQPPKKKIIKKKVIKKKPVAVVVNNDDNPSMFSVSPPVVRKTNTNNTNNTNKNKKKIIKKKVTNEPKETVDNDCMFSISPEVPKKKIIKKNSGEIRVENVGNLNITTKVVKKRVIKKKIIDEEKKNVKEEKEEKKEKKPVVRKKIIKKKKRATIPPGEALTRIRQSCPFHKFEKSNYNSYSSVEKSESLPCMFDD